MGEKLSQRSLVLGQSTIRRFGPVDSRFRGKDGLDAALSFGIVAKAFSSAPDMLSGGGG